MKEGVKNPVTKELFQERIFESNVFTQEEKNVIMCNINLYKKCYLLGIIDRKYA